MPDNSRNDADLQRFWVTSKKESKIIDTFWE